MRGLRSWLVSALAVSAMAACTAESGREEEQGDVGLAEAAVTSLDPNGAQPVAITEPAALRDLEKRGFGFGHHFGAPDDVRADVLERSPGWSSIAHAISVNLDTYRRACNTALPCRDDYVCAFVPGAPSGTGACMPPYFIFQARLDGHE